MGRREIARLALSDHDRIFKSGGSPGSRKGINPLRKEEGGEGDTAHRKVRGGGSVMLLFSALSSGQILRGTSVQLYPEEENRPSNLGAVKVSVKKGE